MSRFVSARDADYVSLEQKLLKRRSVMESEVAEESDGTADDAQSESPASPALPPAHSPPASSAPVDVALDVEQAAVPGLLHTDPVVARKLGTWDGVFMPVTLNVLGIILFLRFGFILGQAGLVGALLLLVLSYGVDTLTVLCLNAISTNGQVRGGGAYYLISRSLGPEFGGSIGLVFFFGQAFNAAMNVLGCVESLMGALGQSRGNGLLPEGTGYLYLYGTIVLWLSTLVCLFGSSLFSRATLLLAVILSMAVASIPVSAIFVQPFEDAARDVYYSGWSRVTFAENLWPHFTTGAAGSSTAPDPESWRSVFGVLFPAVCGILAGASMSGDLRKPSKSIPKGTNWSLLFTFVVYVAAFVIMASTIPRESFYRNVGIIGDVALWPVVVVLGELASCTFSALMGVMACAKVLQAIARDDLLPVFAPFAQGTASGDVPVYALIATCILCQLVLLLDSINLIAQLVTMTTLLTFGVLCAATFALKAGGAPSFRPSFRYWNIWTAGAGTVASLCAMLFADAYVACVCIAVTALLFILIQIFCPPKPWGDVSHNVTYHFVRKYLLRLDERKGHVKYWRPQILLLVNNPRTDWNVIIFCNSLKKGALYILGHVLKGGFQSCLPELRQQHLAWLNLVDVSGVKSFVDVVIAHDEREGARNLILSSGLGGMRPNIIVLGFPSELQLPSALPRGPRGDEHRLPDWHPLPTDPGRKESPIHSETYVGILEDALALNRAFAVAYGFDAMSLPGPSRVAHYQPPGTTQYIDLWPIQIASHGHGDAPTWDTYTMVLQLGTILSFTGTWSKHKLRVNVFVEHGEEIEAERTRVRALLDNLRIPASLRVFCLSGGGVPRYDAIVLGKRALDADLRDALKDDPWWSRVCAARAAQDRAAEMHSEPIELSRKTDAPPPRRTPRPHARQSGVSLPEANLAYHYNNIRLGLAHPHSQLRHDSDPEWHESDADETDYDDLESELASLAIDWDPKYVRHQRKGQLTADAASAASYGTLSSSQRTVTPATAHPELATSPGGASTPKGPRARPSLSVRTSPRGVHQRLLLRSTPPGSRPTPPGSAGGSRSASPASTVGAERVPLFPVPRDAYQLSFNELTNLAQYMIINELLRTNSGSDTSVVFTALPAPEPGTATSREASSAYLHQLQRLYGGGPPVMGVHATTLTMTMSL